jgi:oligopeptide transport system substrate-binding protein
MNTDEHRLKNKNLSVSICVYLWTVTFVLLLSSCSELEKPTPEPFYSETAPPQKKEFRWSNGKMPKSLDPALAVAPPETDIVRAIYEGLTDTDPKTLKAVPAIAVDWSSSNDSKIWTFKLRPNARWSNNERVTANDFVRSWKRLAENNKKASSASSKLLQNIVGMQAARDEGNTASVVNEDADKILSNPLVSPGSQFLSNQPLNSNTAQQNLPKLPPPPPETDKKTSSEPKRADKIEPNFGVEAVDNFTLKVSLINPDKDFPALVAHPVFRPIYGDGKELETDKLNALIVTNGAFRISSIGQDGITLDRADYFWNKDSVELEKVRFVPTENAEKALEAYRKGEVDAVTNADFEPLALKLLTPYDDFRRTTHSALNFYEFNRSRVPFDDRRVREALAIAIERERLTEGDTEGATKPALGFLPFDDEIVGGKLTQDVEKARTLLAEAGFPDGVNFPAIRLVVNRNEIQQRIARSVVKMWKQNLNVDTEIIVKETVELEATKAAGDFDLIRRGEVLPTADEAINMLTIFPPKILTPEKSVGNKTPIGENSGVTQGSKMQEQQQQTAENINKSENNIPTENVKSGDATVTNNTDEKNPAIKSHKIFDGEAIILTEAQAIEELSAIPLYFPTSYSLVKPYIRGFEINILDAPSLKDVKIDFTWQPKKASGES